MRSDDDNLKPNHAHYTLCRSQERQREVLDTTIAGLPYTSSSLTVPSPVSRQPPYLHSTHLDNGDRRYLETNA